MKRIKNIKYFGSLKISLIYLLISSVYIIFSDRIVVLIFGNTLSVEMLTTIEIYKGLGFVFVTSIILFVLIQRETKAKRKSIHELELQKENLLNLTEENEKVKSRLQDRNVYIETILKYLPIGLAVNKMDDGNTVFMNKNFTDIYGWPEKDLVNLESFFESVYPDEEYRNMIRERVLEDINSGDPNRMRWYGIEITTSSGEKKFINAQNIPVFDQNLMISTVIDITEQKNANLKLKESEEKYKLLAENTTDVISLLDTDGRFLYVSPSGTTASGYEPNEVLGKKSHIYFHPDDVSLVTSDTYWNKLKAGLSILLIYRFKSKDGKYRWFESNRQPVLNNKNELIKIVSVSRDITERVEREKIIDNYQKSLKKLTTEISLTEEKQRKEIAANIHDHLSQLLVISKMKLNDLHDEIVTENAQKEFKSVIQYIEEALDNSRKITYDLCPPVLYEMGLIETMYWLADKTQQEHHIKTSFITDLNKIKLSESKLILVFRVIQELVNNTVKHAQANNLKIEMKVNDELLEIKVSDDGKGFNKNELPKAKVGEGGFGLFAVKERVQNLDGRISINSEKNTGTTIKISVPYI